jgi:hypothetical protein
MSNVRRPGNPLGEPADGEDTTPSGELVEEGPRSFHLVTGGSPIRPRGAGVRRHDVPAQSWEPELSQDALDDRGGRLGRPGSCHLALGGERDAGDTGSAVAGRFANEQKGGARANLEVFVQPASSLSGTIAFAIEVECRSDPCGSQMGHEPFAVHSVTMLMTVRGRVAAIVAASAGVCVPAAHAAPPQGVQTDAAFAASYGQRSVTSVAATAQRISCYAPQVLYQGALPPAQGYPDGGSTLCGGTATTGENVGPYATQNVANPPLRAKDFSESDLHVDPANPRHLIGVSKWVVNAEGYNHLTGFFESFDGGATWPQLGHIPGYEAWTDNSDPAGGFDPWGNFYVVVLPYMFSYGADGQHSFLDGVVNPSLPPSGIGVAVRPKGSSSADTWNVSHGGHADLIATTPFNGASVFDKQWIAIDTNPRSRHFGRVYVSWAIGNSDLGLRIYASYSQARRNGTHGNWSRPKLVLRQSAGLGDNGSLPRVAPDGRVWLTTSSFGRSNGPLTMSLTWSTNGGRSWARRRVIVRHVVNGYANTTFRSAFGEAFIVAPRKVGGFYPLYVAYEHAVSGNTAIFVRGSFDGGRRWSPAIQVNDAEGQADALQPNLAVAPNGTVAVAFYDRRLACPARDTVEAAIAGLSFDPRAPYGRANYCIDTAIQFYRPRLRPVGHNIRLSEHSWDPQLSSPRPACVCDPGGFIGDYFGVDSRGGFTYTASVGTFNVAGENPGYHQQQLVSKVRTP